MKKIIVCISLIFAMSAGVTAMAAETAEYIGGDANSTTVNAEGYRTVLIQNDSTDEIVYANQKDDYFSASTEFLLQENPDPGTYTLTLGGHSTEVPKPMTLIITDDTPEQVIVNATPMGRQPSAGDKSETHYDLGCKIEGVAASNCQWIVITSTRDSHTKTLYVQPSPALTGEGEINVGIRVNNIENAVEVTVGVANTDVAN